MTAREKWGWGIVVAVPALLVVNGIGLYTVIVETHVERTIGVLLTAFGALGLVVALEARKGAGGGRTAVWVMVGALVAIGLHTLRGDQIEVPLTYLGLAGLMTVGIALARPGREADA